MINNIKRYDNIIIVFFVFTFISSNFFEKNIFGVGIDLFAILFFLIYFVFFIDWDKGFNKKYIFSISSFICFQIFVCKINNFALFGLIKQLIPIMIIYTSTYLIILKFGFKKILTVYEKIVILMCLFGILQIFLNYFDISLFQKEKWRMNSLMREPSHFGMFILPIVLKNIFEFKKLNIKLFLFLVSIFLTLSVSVIFSLILSIIIFNFWIFFNSNDNSIFKSKFLLFTTTIIITFITLSIFYIYINNEISSGTLNALIKKNDHFILNDIFFYESYNGMDFINNLIFNDEFFSVIQLSFFSIISILKVSANMLIQNPFGAGLGSNEEAFYLFKETYVNNVYLTHNAGEGNLIKRTAYASKSSQSLFLRMIIEFGILFIFSFLLLIFKIFRNLHSFDKTKVSIFLCFFSVILFKITKLGSYIDYGTGFFLISIIILIMDKNEFYKNFN